MTHFELQENAFLKNVLGYLLSLEDARFYLVGGAVRDALLQKPSHDLDFIVAGNSVNSARKLADHIQGAFYILDEVRKYARVLACDEEGNRVILDFAPLYQDDLIADLQSRDFTVNAIAWKVSSQNNDLIDPLGGVNDLQQGILRPCSDQSYFDDPVRMIRTARFAVEYNLNPLGLVSDQIHAALPKLAEVSEERKRDEFFKILEIHQVKDALEILQKFQILGNFLPELQALVGFDQGSPHQFNAWQHTLLAVHYMESMLNYIEGQKPIQQPLLVFDDVFQLLDLFSSDFQRTLARPMNVNRGLRSLILFASLFHDVGKPLDIAEKFNGRIRYSHHADLGAKAAAARVKKMALSKIEIQWVECFIENHMLLHDLDISASESEQRLFLHRFFQSAEQSSPFVALFTLADLLATYDKTLDEERWQAGLYRCEHVLKGWFGEYALLANPIPFFNGDELQKKFHLNPGKKLGILINELREAQAAGIVTSKQQAVNWVHEWLNKKKVDGGSEIIL